jgi:hypothetical protein
MFGPDDEDDEYDGLPDAAFTELELAAGVQHIVRTGDPNATSSGSRRNSYFSASDEWSDVEQQNDVTSQSTSNMRFATFAEAQSWAKENPGSTFTRATDGSGFESKVVKNRFKPRQDDFDSYWKRTESIKNLAPYLHNVLTKSASNSQRIVLQPFRQAVWQDELLRLDVAQLTILRHLLFSHLNDSKKRLNLIYKEMRRVRSMKPGHYGEALSEKLHKIMEEVLVFVDQRLSETF